MQDSAYFLREIFNRVTIIQQSIPGYPLEETALPSPVPAGGGFSLLCGAGRAGRDGPPSGCPTGEHNRRYKIASVCRRRAPARRRCLPGPVPVKKPKKCRCNLHCSGISGMFGAGAFSCRRCCGKRPAWRPSGKKRSGGWASSPPF